MVRDPRCQAWRRDVTWTKPGAGLCPYRTSLAAGTARMLMSMDLFGGFPSNPPRRDRIDRAKAGRVSEHAGTRRTRS